ncbi:uncharacterized protein LOC111706871 isoform X2 [Eurytemora carolleeae]|uniref:uncharacterized protein LOC111706871 isoform X2 n=1 Tax=Eurytemora carolleeae TaxID=1294199 RepID=UPI000C7823D3|nr:uncharacterized protein LOC111706871 isoform X2 [Eurytemora carolleeae]|eukprot:XP_023335571.1 uncharacterized protein LOC111706871 isoform X2 [Eurytemora affinis]
MEKASKALRRSGVRIKSIGSGHSELQMVISQLKDVRVASKGFATAQSAAMQDLVKWSLKDENRAIQDALTQVGELFSIWTEVQREFNDHMKEFRYQFEMILEGARQLDVARSTLLGAEQKETRIKKELKKAAKKATAEEIREMSGRLTEAEREKDIAQLEVVDRVREHEVVKLIRIKEGVFKVSEAYIDYAQKCEVIFGAQRDIALQLPDVTDRDIQDIKYTGSGATMQAVAKAKDKIKRFRRARSSTSVPTVGTVDDLPPPYSENPPVNPFYNEYLHSVDGGNVSLNSSRRGDESPGDGRPLVGSPLHPHQYPFNQPYSPLGHPPLNIKYRAPLMEESSPPYQVQDQFSHVTRRTPQQQVDPLNYVTRRTPQQDQFSHVTRRSPLMRRNSYFSDAEDVTEAISSINLSLNKR